MARTSAFARAASARTGRRMRLESSEPSSGTRILSSFMDGRSSRSEGTKRVPLPGAEESASRPRHPGCPPRPPSEAPVIDSILVPLDGSPLATRALLLVRRIVEHRAAFHEPAPRIHLVRAAGPEELAAAREELDVVAAQIGASAEAHVLEGDAAAGILAVVSETKPALVIMASHGRGGLDRWLRGSVAERVLRACPAPLLVANPWAL